MLSLLLAFEDSMTTPKGAIIFCLLWLGVSIVASMIFWLRPGNFYGKVE